MKDLNTEDYFECLKFHQKVLDVVDNQVSLDGVRIRFDDLMAGALSMEDGLINKGKPASGPKGKIHLFIVNIDDCWVLAGVDPEDTRFVLAAGQHQEA